MTEMPIVVAALGDSITAGIPGWSPDPAERAARDMNNPESQWEYWAALRDPRLQFRNYGIGRQETSEIATRAAARCWNRFAFLRCCSGVPATFLPESASGSRWRARW